jgi:thiol-disulfide isomerase/thioredoxin
MKKLLFLFAILIFYSSGLLALEVITHSAINISYTSATTGGEVASNKKGLIIARGICWDISHKPTINDNFTQEGSGIGSFTAKIKDLEPGKTYFIRAYAIKSNGVKYGQELSFITKPAEKPLVETIDVVDINFRSANCQSKIISNGGSDIIKQGVCWSIDPNPTIDDNFSINDIKINNYESKINNLQEETIYYVRAFAANNLGITYGEILTFKTLKISHDAIPKMVDFKSPTAPPCRAMEPVIAELQVEYAHIFKLESVDVSKKENQQRAIENTIKYIPTQIFYDENGKQLFRHTGFFSKQQILDKWKELGYYFIPSQ